MNINGTLQSWGSSLYGAAGSAATSVKNFANATVEKGTMAGNKAVTVIRENPKAAVITGLAIATVALSCAYFSMGNGAENVVNPDANQQV